MSTRQHEMDAAEFAQRYALGELDEDHREVVVLRNLEQLDWEVIARKMNRSNGAVRMLWFRAIRKLREQLEARGLI